MSYTPYDDDGVEVYLCWNCGRIHVYKEETQHEGTDDEFLEKLIDKRSKQEKE